MSTWTSRAGLLSAGLLLLAGCSELRLPGASGEASAPETVSVARGAVTVAGPRGYCVDRAASRMGGTQPVLVMASCAAITGEDGAPHPSRPALLTASIRALPETVTLAPGFIDRLRAYFETTEGRAALARDGQAGSVDILEMSEQGGSVQMLVEDRSAPVPPGTGARYWRTLFPRNGQLVTLSVLSFEESPLNAAAGEATLAEFRRAVLRASPEGTGAVERENPAAGPFAALRGLLPGN
jgi:hypothetical protein